MFLNRMTFKERYQSGLCDLSAIESCITQWEQAKDCKNLSAGIPRPDGF